MGGNSAQERLSNELCLFSWQGYPRWPGIVVPLVKKSDMLAGKGHFYPPKKEIFSTAFVAERRGALKADKPGMYEVQHAGRWRPATLRNLNRDGTVDASLSSEDADAMDLLCMCIGCAVGLAGLQRRPANAFHTDRRFRGGADIPGV